MTATKLEHPPVEERGAVLVPGYEVVRHLSRGHRLDVYDCWSSNLQTRCVVKVVRPDRAHEPHVVADLLQEGWLLHDLAHPHLVRAFDVVEAPPAAVVLETLTGPSLADVIDDRGSLDVGDAALLGAQLASALQLLHRHGWLHADLTATNVVVEGTRAMLIDLSLATRPGPCRAGTGTTGYRAPEQASGREVSTATDVWGLGVLLFETLTGRLPEDPDPKRAPRLLKRRARWLPPQLAPAVAGCLDPDPSLRWTLAEVSAAMTQIVPLR